MRCVIAFGVDTDSLVKDVNRLQSEGYLCSGGLCVADSFYYQNMILGDGTVTPVTYSIVRSQSDVDFAEQVNKTVGKPLGSLVRDVSFFTQAFGTDIGNSSDGGPEYYYVLTIAGQSNAMAYGEGVPLPDTLDKVDPRIKQLARRPTITPGGVPCVFDEVIPLDHCAHDVQDMSMLNNPGAVLPAQYGCVGQALHIAKKLLPSIPLNAGILVVPCSRGGSAFTKGVPGTYSATTGASSNATLWGAGTPLYTDMVHRTKAALNKNPLNIMLGVVWMQGEFDMMQSADYGKQPSLFNAMRDSFINDMQSHLKQIPGFNATKLPWVCGGTTYWWKNTYNYPYTAIYANYASREKESLYFVPLLTANDGTNIPTNLPAEDPNIPAADYYGSANRTAANWTSTERASHFSSFARRGEVSSRLALKLMEVCNLVQAGHVPQVEKSLKFTTPLPATTPFTLGTPLSFTVAVTGGKAPYTYVWYNRATGLVMPIYTATMLLTSNASASLNNVTLVAAVSDANGDTIMSDTILKQNP